MDILSINGVFKEGKELNLSNGVLFEINTDDYNLVKIWEINSPVKVEKLTSEKIKNKFFPYRIINLKTKSSVFAARITF